MPSKLAPTAASVSAAQALNFSVLYQKLPIPVAVLDKNFSFIEVNEAFETQFELSRGQLLGRNNVLVYADNTAEEVRQTRHELSQQAEPASDNIREIVTGSGRHIEVKVSVRAVGQGDELVYLVLYQDLLETQERAKVLLSRSDVFMLTIEESPVPTTLQDGNFKLLLANRAACDLLGYRREEILGRDPLEWDSDGNSGVSKSERWAFRQQARKNYSGHLTANRLAIHGVTGKEIPYRIEVGRTFGFNGEEMWCAMLHDLRPTRSLEHKLGAQIDWNERAFDQAPVGMLLTDKNGELLQANKSLTRITGLKDDSDLLFLADQARLAMTTVKESSDDGAEFANGRFSLRHKSGAIQWLDGSSTNLTSTTGAEITVTAIKDATREQLLKTELTSSLLRQSALLRCMDAGLAHVIGELVVQVNPALLGLTGKPENELLGQPVEVLFGDSARWQELMPDVVAALAELGLYRTTERIPRADGQTRRCEVVFRRVDVERADLGILVTLTDVSDLLEQSDQLRQSIEDVRSQNDTGSVGIVTLEHGCMVRTNRAMAALLGHAENDILGRRFTDFYDDNLDLNIDGGSNSLDSLTRERVFRVNLKRLDNSYIDCLLHAAPASTADRNSVTVVVVDLSQRNAALSLAVRMQLRFDAFASSLNEAVLVLSPGGDRVIHANQATKKIFARDPVELMRLSSHTLWSSVLNDDMSRLESALSRLTTGKPSQTVVKMRHADSEEITVRLRMFGGDANLREHFILAEDISQERQLARKRIEEAVAQRETLVREVHHRIKNNLQGVAGLLQQSAIRQPELSPILSEVASQIHAIAQVHGLQFRGDQALRPGEIVMAIADNLCINFGQRLDCEELPGADLQWIVPEGEAVPLALVINELMTNAFKHSSDERSVKVTVSPNTNGVLIKVVNSGQLPPGFDFDGQALASNGLGLVKALIPRRGAQLVFDQTDNQVVISFGLTRPALSLGPTVSNQAQSGKTSERHFKAKAFKELAQTRALSEQETDQ